MENACLYKLCSEYICLFYYRSLFFAVISMFDLQRCDSEFMNPSRMY